MWDIIFWHIFRGLLEFVAGCAGLMALLGVGNVPVFPIENHFVRAVLGIATFLLLGQMLLNIDHAMFAYRHGMNDGTDAIVWMFVTVAILIGWLYWVWRVEIWGFIYSFTEHPAANALDRYVRTNEGFGSDEMKEALRQIPDDPILQRVRAKQARDLASKLEEATEHEIARLKLYKMFTALRRTRHDADKARNGRREP